MAGEVNDTTIVGGASVNMVTEANAAKQAGLAADGANKGVPSAASPGAPASPRSSKFAAHPEEHAKRAPV